MPSSERNTILFFGELGSELHGISVSSRLNLSMLEQYFDVSIVVESSLVGTSFRNKIEKLKRLAVELYDLSLSIRKKKPSIFYYVFSNSLFGFLKNWLIIKCIDFFSDNMKIVTHLHRGDILAPNGNLLLNRIATYLLNKSSYIICLEESQARFIRNQCCKKVVVLKNTVNESSIFQCAETMKRLSPDNLFDSPASCNRRKILVVANYLESKNIFNIARIVSDSEICKKIEINFYGNYTDKYNELAVNMFSQNMPGINFLGPIRNIEKEKIFLEHDFLLMPSINEGVPIVILEAMVIGCPVISMNTGYVEDMLGGDYPLLIRNYDSDGILEVLEAALNLSKSESAKITQRNKERYKNLYSNVAHQKSLIKLFSEILESDGS